MIIGYCWVRRFSQGTPPLLSRPHSYTAIWLSLCKSASTFLFRPRDERSDFGLSSSDSPVTRFCIYGIYVNAGCFSHSLSLTYTRYNPHRNEGFFFFYSENRTTLRITQKGRGEIGRNSRADTRFTWLDTPSLEVYFADSISWHWLSRVY